MPKAQLMCVTVSEMIRLARGHGLPTWGASDDLMHVAVSGSETFGAAAGGRLPSAPSCVRLRIHQVGSQVSPCASAFSQRCKTVMAKNI